MSWWVHFVGDSVINRNNVMCPFIYNTPPTHLFPQTTLRRQVTQFLPIFGALRVRVVVKCGLTNCFWVIISYVHYLKRLFTLRVFFPWYFAIPFTMTARYIYLTPCIVGSIVHNNTEHYLKHKLLSYLVYLEFWVAWFQFWAIRRKWKEHEDFVPILQVRCFNRLTI